ncbi:hypothetical protein NPX99_01545 [Bartonella sp. 220]|uniref:hypothetical protein n=1 Tax=Bartonella sp. 220B TaxID=2967260 RepID=UPI0022A9A8BA|nr:hypothetical protein [Bartonella sp. 220B]MCZ2157976.1 hypothetical protein [Bartonella sp. 220B]
MSASTVMMVIVFAGIIIVAFLWDAVVRHKKAFVELYEQFEKFATLKNRECEIYKDIIAQWEEKLFKKTKKYQVNGLNNGMRE